MSLKAIIVSRKLPFTTREKLILYNSRFNIWLKYLLGLVSTFIIVNIEFFYTLFPVPFYPFLEIWAFIFGYRTYR